MTARTDAWQAECAFGQELLKPTIKMRLLGRYLLIATRSVGAAEGGRPPGLNLLDVVDGLWLIPGARRSWTIF